MGSRHPLIGTTGIRALPQKSFCSYVSLSLFSLVSLTRSLLLTFSLSATWERSFHLLIRSILLQISLLPSTLSLSATGGR